MHTSRPPDIRAKLLKDRIILIGEPIDQMVAEITCREIDLLNTQGRQDITIYINSPGGLVDESFSIIDKIISSRVDVATVCIGQAAGTAAMILAAGKHRFAKSGSRISLTPVSGKVNNEAELSEARRQCADYWKTHAQLSADELLQAFSRGLELDLDTWVRKGLISGIVG